MGQTQKVGSLGEELAERFLVKRGFRILHRNYWRPWGELDIVAERKNKLHFIEVKALSQTIVSDETGEFGTQGKGGVSNEQSQISNNPHSSSEGCVTHETSREDALTYVRSKIKKDRFMAEEKVDTKKMKRLGRIIQTYLSVEHVSDETSWQFDVVTVLVDLETKRARIKLIEDITL